MGHLLMLRHGQSEWNALGRWQGHADSVLSEKGRREAAAAAEGLAAHPFASLVSSDLTRARQTAEILGECLGLGPVRVEPALREIDVGQWSGLLSHEIEERWPGLRQLWREGKLERPPGGEPMEDFVARVVPAAVRLLHEPAPVLVVSHGGVIRALEGHVGEDPQPIGNLGGRWFSLRGQRLVAEAAVRPPEPPADPVDRPAGMEASSSG